ncbi:hypothetical protein [Celeribacter litoreus]|uniref:hypothetical protein n=1 Tax=Celeribacter litoreus TaxID=2876714 RepID=UPI001CCD6F64|nr:hypothetical protein [Celeribacter litoreus]MCA0044095.1 hypothetical protein [Celeribacter litoreus]
METERRNELPYSNMDGAVPGSLVSGGALPVNWAVSGIAQSALTVENVSLVNGLPNLRLRVSGTLQGTMYVFLSSATSIPASVAETWSLSLWAGLASGSMTNVSDISLHASGWTSGAGYVSGSPFSGLDFSTVLSANPVLFECQGSLSGAQTECIRPALRLAASGEIDLTLDLLMPNATDGKRAFAGLPTSAISAQQSAENIVITGIAPATYDVVVRSEALGESVRSNEQVTDAYWPKGVSDDIVRSVCFYPPGTQ